MVKVRLFGVPQETKLISALLGGGLERLGRVDIPLSMLSGRDRPPVQTFQLVRGTGTTAVPGANITLSFRWLAFDKPDLLEVPDYHAMYLTVLERVLTLQSTGFLARSLWPKTFRFLEEFGKRYGVRALYRRVMHVEQYYKHFSLTPGGIEHFSHREAHSLIASAYNVFHRSNSVKPTVIEFDSWSASQKTALALSVVDLERFREAFPFNKPERELASLLETIRLLHTTDSAQATAVIRAAVDTCNTEFYKTHLAESIDQAISRAKATGSSLSDTELIFTGYIDCIAVLRGDIADLMAYFSSSFLPTLHVTHMAAALYGTSLMADTEALMEGHQDLKSIVIFKLLAAMRMVFDEAVHAVEEGASLPPLKVSPYIHFVYSYLESVGSALLPHLQELIQDDDNVGAAKESNILESAKLLAQELRDVRLYAFCWMLIHMFLLLSSLSPFLMFFS